MSIKYQYVSESNRTSMLVELIAKLDELVKKNRVAAAGAFYAVAEVAKEHPYWPEEEKPPMVIEPGSKVTIYPSSPDHPAPAPVSSLPPLKKEKEDIPF